jgi:hypothetical protein
MQSGTCARIHHTPTKTVEGKQQLQEAQALTSSRPHSQLTEAIQPDHRSKGYGLEVTAVFPIKNRNMEKAASEKEKSGRQKLMESIIEAGSRAFNPDVPEDSRPQAIRDFDDLIQRQA